MHIPDLAHLIQVIGYPGLFAVIFAESGIPIGFFLPGASLLFTAGFLASQGLLDIRIVIPLVGVAAILGDNVGYWFGAKVGIRLFDKPDSRFFKREYLERTQKFFVRYGARTIILARFVPVVRTFAPILAGVALMEYRVFVIYNIAGGLLWASGISYAGYKLSTLIPQTERYISLIVLGIIVVTTLPLFRELWRGRKTTSISKLPRAVIFDLDDTLSPARTVLESGMAERLAKLSKATSVAVMSGAGYTRVHEQFVSNLSPATQKDSLFLFPANAGQCYQFKDGAWRTTYDLSLPPGEKRKIINAIEETVSAFPEFKDIEARGQRIFDFDAQISFVAPGFDTPREEKKAWDPDKKKRERFRAELRKKLPEYQIYIGGTTSLDIIKTGVDKAYGVRWLARQLGCAPSDMLFVGDGLYEGGNDSVVIPTGIETRQVAGPTTTAEVIDELLEKFKTSK